MAKRKLYLGIAGPLTKKIQTVRSVRMDLINRDRAHELFSQLIDEAYDDFEETQGDEDEFID